MKILFQTGIRGRVSASPKKRFLLALVGVIGFTWIQSLAAGENKGSPALAQNEESHQGKAEAVQGSSSSKGVVFNGMTLDDLAELEKKANANLSKKALKSLSKEKREAFAQAKKEAVIAWGKYKEHYLQQMNEANVERAKQGKELYQEFIIPRGTATYMSFNVKIEDLTAGIHDGGYRGPMRYRYFVPEIGEGEKAPLILFLHGIDFGRGTEHTRHGTDNRYQFKDPEILAFVQPEAQEKYPCFLVAPQQFTEGAWCSPGREPNVALENAVDIVGELIARYPQIDPKRLYVTGVAAGSAGAFDAVAKYPNKFAAVVAMSGGRTPNMFGEKQKSTAWISYCKEGEPPVVPKHSDVMFDLFKSWGGDSRLVVYPSKGHMSWEYGYVDKNLYKWLFQQSL